MNMQKLSQIPTELLKDITVNPDEKPAAAIPADPAGSDVPEVSPDDVFKTGAGAEIPSMAESIGSGGAPSISQNNASPVAPIKAGGVISGAFTVGIMDALVPALVILLFSAVGYGGIEKKTLSLTQKEKDMIAPAMQQYLDSINLNFNNPLQNLLFVVGAVYGAKVIEILPELKKKDRSKPGLLRTLPTAEKIEKQAQDVARRVETTQHVKKVKEMEYKEVLKLDQAAAIAFIAEKRRKGKQDATDFYFKLKKTLR